jgi:hypothetical protein
MPRREGPPAADPQVDADLDAREQGVGRVVEGLLLLPRPMNG